MESFELKIFKEVAYTKSITKAAENMGYVQSNITAHIKKLEAELNTALIIRSNKGITLTKSGENLLYQAEKIIDLLDKATKSFVNTPKSLNLGTTQTIAGYLLPQCLMEYQKKFPNVAISVNTLQQASFDTQLSNGQLDCIITNSQHEITQGKQIFQYPEKLILIAPSSCVSLNQIRDFPIIVNNIASCPYRKTFLNWWNLQEFELSKIVELDTVEAILNTIVIGGGISLLPKSVLHDTTRVNSFYIEELQSTSIHFWIAKNKLPQEYTVLKNILEDMLKNNN